VHSKLEQPGLEGSGPYGPGLERRARLHAALSDPARLAIVEDLAVTDRSPKELAESFDLATNLLAHHLEVLEKAGLIERFVSAGDRRRRYVRLLREPLDGLGIGTPRGWGSALFVCSHNSARSQLAAALWRERVGRPAQSAGTHPAERVHPGAVAAAARAGLDMGDAVPRLLDDSLGADVVVTVCDRAHEELDPEPSWLHWSLPDPVELGTGTESASPARVGINGFGRIGRLVARALRHRPELAIVHINDARSDAATSAHLLEFDTVHGRLEADIGHDRDSLSLDGSVITHSSHDTPGAVPWDDRNVDMVLECSGEFRTSELLAPYFERSVRKVVVAAPVNSQGVLNIVMGCNDHLYDPAVHHVVTAASCTTNCLAPVVKVLHEAIGIERGVITTIHDVTNTQVVVDAPHKDLRRARSALNSLIPTSTGSATAITMIYPELTGKLDGVAVRVPLLNASLTDAVFTMQRDVTVEEVNDHFRAAATGALEGILGFEERPLVSADYTNDTRSSIVDGPSTMVVDGRMVKVLAWYDNEYGYAFRMADLAAKVASDVTLEDGSDLGASP
jgi:glyceraldehyde 3-phosphate dehydrogenase